MESDSIEEPLVFAYQSRKMAVPKSYFHSVRCVT